MTRAAALAVTIGLTACVGGSSPPPSYPLWQGRLPAPSAPVWLVGLDGASWSLIRPLLERGDLPTFARLIAEGTHGTLLSEEPTISPALWATIISGVPRAVHGVDNFFVKPPGAYDAVEVGPPDRRVPAVWDHVSAAGGSSTVVSWFGSFPAEPISGAYVSKGTDPANPGEHQVHPPQLREQLPELVQPRLDADSAGEIARSEFLTKTMTEDATTLATLETLAARSSADFVAVYFSGIDVVQHVTWKHMDPAYEPFPDEGPREEAFSGVIPAYYRFADRLLARVLELAPDDATVIVVSDHGAGPMEPQDAFHFRLEVLLGKLGYTTEQWETTTAFAISELHRERKRIFLNVEGVEARGIVPAHGVRSTVERIAARLSALRTDDGERVFRSVVANDTDPAWEPGQPALTVEFSRAALFTRTARDGEAELDFDDVRLRQSDVSGDHRLEGILLARGPMIDRRRLEQPANLYNIAPTLLYLLGLPQDDAMLRHVPAGGGVLREMLVHEMLEQRPILMVSGYPGIERAGQLRGGGAVESDPAREEALEKLRSLGYVE